MSPPTTATALLGAVTVITAVLGGSLSSLAGRAARRRGSRPLRLFSVGFGVLTVGMLVGGLGVLAFGWGTTGSLVAQGVLVTLGLAIVTTSLYAAPSSPTGS